MSDASFYVVGPDDLRGSAPAGVSPQHPGSPAASGPRALLTPSPSAPMPPHAALRDAIVADVLAGSAQEQAHGPDDNDAQRDTYAEVAMRRSHSGGGAPESNRAAAHAQVRLMAAAAGMELPDLDLQLPCKLSRLGTPQRKKMLDTAMREEGGSGTPRGGDGLTAEERAYSAASPRSLAGPSSSMAALGGAAAASAGGSMHGEGAVPGAGEGPLLQLGDRCSYPGGTSYDELMELELTPEEKVGVGRGGKGCILGAGKACSRDRVQTARMRPTVAITPLATHAHP